MSAEEIDSIQSVGRQLGDNRRSSDTSRRGSEAPMTDDSSARDRPLLIRRKTGDPVPRPVFPTRKPVNRSYSGNPKDKEFRRSMVDQRATSTRDFGRPQAGRGLAMARNAGRSGMVDNRSMSTRFLGVASDFTRMASTRGLFMEDPVQQPSIIVYMGREIKVEDHFDDEWIEDALDEGAFRSDSSQTHDNSRISQDTSQRNHGEIDCSRTRENDIDKEAPDDDDSEVEEDMEEMEADTSATRAMDSSSKRSGRRGSRRPTDKRRSQSSEGVRPKRPAPLKRKVGRSRTFDGRQTSEILPRRRKAKNRSSRQLTPIKHDLNRQFQDFLSKTGGVTPTGNHPYQNGQQFTVDGIRRRQPKMPTSRRRVEQFRRLEYTADDIKDVLCEDDDTFQRLKRVLTKKGAITNGILQQRLHIFLKKAKDRQSKLAHQRREEEGAKGDDGETDNLTNLQSTQLDWAAMSMMDMFAQSVRKLTVDTESASTPPAQEPTAEEKFQRRALPRMQAVMAKRGELQAKKSSPKKMATFTESEEEEESSNDDNSENLNSAKEGRKSPSRDNPAASSKLSPIRRPRAANPILIQKRDSTNDYDGEADLNFIQPKELPVTREPMTLDLSHKFKEAPPIARELPSSRKPMQLDLTQGFKGELLIQPKCLDNDSSIPKRPMTLDLLQNFSDLPIQLKCLDDELSASQRPMELDLSQTFQGELPIPIKCLDDSKADNKPLKLDLSAGGSGGRALLFEPKSLDDSEKDDVEFLFQPKNLDEPKKMDGSRKMEDGSKTDGHTKLETNRAQRRHRPSRIRNFSSGTKGSTSKGSSMAVSNTRDRVRRSKSYEEPPPLKLDVKCIDDPEPPKSNGAGTRDGSSAKPAPPGLLVGWQH